MVDYNGVIPGGSGLAVTGGMLGNEVLLATGLVVIGLALVMRFGFRPRKAMSEA